MIIQILYGMMTVSADNNNHVEYQHVTEEFNYHMVLKDLNEYQALYLVNDKDTVFKSDIIFEVVRHDENLNYLTGVITHDVYLRFTRDDLDLCEKRFRENYLEDLSAYGTEGKSFAMEKTQLLTFQDNINANRVAFVFITLLLLAVVAGALFFVG